MFPEVQGIDLVSRVVVLRGSKELEELGLVEVLRF